MSTRYGVYFSYGSWVPTMTVHQQIYQSADLYDLAFSYRDFAEECRFLRHVYAQRRGRPPKSFLELAAGPARHALEMNRAGLTATALDLVPEMSQRGLALARQQGLSLAYITDDMTSFKLDAPVDLAACLLISATYLTKEASFLAHLQSVARALTAGGVYVLELPLHWDDMVDPQTQHQPQRHWEMQDSGGTLQVSWSEAPRSEGEVTHVATAKLSYLPSGAQTGIVLEESAVQREYRAAEVVELAHRAGFVVVGTWGDWDFRVPLSSPRAWRLLVALERCTA